MVLVLHALVGLVFFIEAFKLLLVMTIVGVVLFFFTKLFILIPMDAFVTLRIFFNAEKVLLDLGSSIFEADLFCLRFGTYTSFWTSEIV